MADYLSGRTSIEALRPPPRGQRFNLVTIAEGADPNPSAHVPKGHSWDTYATTAPNGDGVSGPNGVVGTLTPGTTGRGTYDYPTEVQRGNANDRPVNPPPGYEPICLPYVGTRINCSHIKCYHCTAPDGNRSRAFQEQMDASKAVVLDAEANRKAAARTTFGKLMSAMSDTRQERRGAAIRRLYQEPYLANPINTKLYEFVAYLRSFEYADLIIQTTPPMLEINIAKAFKLLYPDIHHMHFLCHYGEIKAFDGSTPRVTTQDNGLPTHMPKHMSIAPKLDSIAFKIGNAKHEITPFELVAAFVGPDLKEVYSVYSDTNDLYPRKLSHRLQEAVRRVVHIGADTTPFFVCGGIGCGLNLKMLNIAIKCSVWHEQSLDGRPLGGARKIQKHLTAFLKLVFETSRGLEGTALKTYYGNLKELLYGHVMRNHVDTRLQRSVSFLWKLLAPDVSLVFRKHLGASPWEDLTTAIHAAALAWVKKYVVRPLESFHRNPKGAFDSLLKISSPSAPGGYPELDALLLLRVALFKHKGDAFATDCHEIAHPQDYFTRAFQVANMQETLQIDRIVYGNLTTAEYEKKVKTPNAMRQMVLQAPLFVPTEELHDTRESPGHRSKTEHNSKGRIVKFHREFAKKLEEEQKIQVDGWMEEFISRMREFGFDLGVNGIEAFTDTHGELLPRFHGTHGPVNPLEASKKSPPQSVKGRKGTDFASCKAAPPEEKKKTTLLLLYKGEQVHTPKYLPDSPPPSVLFTEVNVQGVLNLVKHRGLLANLTDEWTKVVQRLKDDTPSGRESPTKQNTLVRSMKTMINFVSAVTQLNDTVGVIDLDNINRVTTIAVIKEVRNVMQELESAQRFNSYAELSFGDLEPYMNAIVSFPRPEWKTPFAEQYMTLYRKNKAEDDKLIRKHRHLINGLDERLEVSSKEVLDFYNSQGLAYSIYTNLERLEVCYQQVIGNYGELLPEHRETFMKYIRLIALSATKPFDEALLDVDLEEKDLLKEDALKFISTAVASVFDWDVHKTKPSGMRRALAEEILLTGASNGYVNGQNPATIDGINPGAYKRVGEIPLRCPEIDKHWGIYTRHPDRLYPHNSEADPKLSKRPLPFRNLMRDKFKSPAGEKLAVASGAAKG